MKVVNFKIMETSINIKNANLKLLNNLINKGKVDLLISNKSQIFRTELSYFTIGRVVAINEDIITVVTSDFIYFKYHFDDNYRVELSVIDNGDSMFFDLWYSEDSTCYSTICSNTDKISDQEANKYFDEYFDNNNKLIVRYHREICPDLHPIEINPKGDFIDLRSAERVELKAGDFKAISLGISVKLPKGHWAQVVPRSSTFKNWGILQANSFGVVDESYCGDNDIWLMPVYATRDTIIEVNDRICQFRIVKKDDLPEICEVDKLDGPDRGGLGSTGKN